VWNGRKSLPAQAGNTPPPPLPAEYARRRAYWKNMEKERFEQLVNEGIATISVLMKNESGRRNERENPAGFESVV